METKSMQTDELAEERRRLLAQLLEEEGLEGATSEPAIVPRAERGEAPLTFAREVLWLLDRATPGLTAYNTPVARRLRGTLEVAVHDVSVLPAGERESEAIRRLRQVTDTPFDLTREPGFRVALARLASD